MSKELQEVLMPGDQIITTDVAYFDYNEEVKKKRLYSQQPGDIIMVNNPRVGSDIVSGTGLNGTAHNGRKCVGLGGSLKVGKFRRATPDDVGFMATREQWHRIKDDDIYRLSNVIVTYRVISLVCFLMALWVISASIVK